MWVAVVYIPLITNCNLRRSRNSRKVVESCGNSMRLEPDIIKLGDQLTVRHVAAVQQDLLHLLQDCDAVAIEVPASAQVDISLIQLIEAARHYAQDKDKSLTLVNPADGELLAVLRRGGFLDALSAENAQFWLHQERSQ